MASTCGAVFAGEIGQRGEKYSSRIALGRLIVDRVFADFDH
jgi:hypothetical protein